MGVTVEEQTAHEERMWEHYQKVEAENHHLKNQLDNRNKQIRQLKQSYNSLNTKYKKLIENRKPRFRNNGKAGK